MWTPRSILVACSLAFVLVDIADAQGVLRANASKNGSVYCSGVHGPNLSSVLGTFQMGSTSGNSDEQPVHTVTVDPFYIDKYETTVAQYRAFCTATGRSMPPAPPWGWSEDNPIVFVSWFDATDYAQWAGKRLPTEAEWEYAARGGSLSKGYTYSGSNTVGDVAWYHGNSGARTQAVGTKTPNELGLYDMTGNVDEWCSDWYSNTYYSVSPSVNPPGPSSGVYRVLRGGAYIDLDNKCRAAARLWWDPTLPTSQPGSFIGFRCAQDYVNAVGIGTDSPGIPPSYALEQNYPNPFNPSTTIRYGLPQRSQVTLTVFNTLGQQVAHLVNADAEAGYHEVTFDGSNLASGVYLYRMVAGSYVETKRLLLVR
jgi:sulfatase modifying factor 1